VEDKSLSLTGREAMASGVLDDADRHANGNVGSQVAIMILAHEKWVAAGRPKGDGSRLRRGAERDLGRKEAC